VGRAEQRVIHRLLVEIGILRVVIRQIHLPLEEDLAATGTRLAIGAIAQGIVGSEAFRGFTAAHPSGDVILLLNDVAPQRFDRALVSRVVRFYRNIRHAGVRIDGADSVSDRFVLLHYRQMALIVFLAVAYGIDRSGVAAVQQEFREIYIL